MMICNTSAERSGANQISHPAGGKPATDRPPPTSRRQQASARDVDDRAAGLRAADQLRLPPHAEGAYSMQKLLAEGISPLVRMI